MTSLDEARKAYELRKYRCNRIGDNDEVGAWWIEEAIVNPADELIAALEAVHAEAQQRIAALEGALERIAAGGTQKLEAPSFVSSSEMTRYYIQRIERMKAIAAAALATPAGASATHGDGKEWD